MIVCHKIAWSACLSNTIFPLIEKGWSRWQHEKPIHFFWGLGANNINEIRRCQAKGEEWWLVDLGYISNHIKRYPNPDILDVSKTYFRFCKGGLHNDLKNVSADENRLNELKDKNIFHAVDLDNYKQKAQNKNGHVLLAPSSPTVCKFMHQMNQENWVNQAANNITKNAEIKKTIRFRNKPRPGNKWYETDIRDDLNGASALVTNMSLAAVDAIVAGVPVICHKDNICSSIATTFFEKINNLNTPTKKQVTTWMAKAANCQFTLEEIGNGTAKHTIENYHNRNEQDVSTLPSVVD